MINVGGGEAEEILPPLINDRHHFRRGFYRRNQRDYSVKLRQFGKDSKEVIEEGIAVLLVNQLTSLMLIDALWNAEMKEEEDGGVGENLLFEEFDHEESEDVEFIFYLIVIQYLLHILKVNIPYLPLPDRILRLNITVDNFSEEFIYEQTKFTSRSIRAMLNELHMPVNGFQINEGNHRYLFPTEHAFIFTLARYASKGSSLCSMQHVFWCADYNG